MRQQTIFLLKLLLAAALIYWLVSSGKLDFSLLTDALKNHQQHLFLGALFFLIVPFISSFRWKAIIETQAKEPVALKKVLSATWIGLLFNTVLPGAVTGDIIKIYYLQDEENQLNYKFLLSSIALDRILGLSALISIGGIISFIQYFSGSDLSNELVILFKFNILLLFFVISFFIYLTLPKGAHARVDKLLNKIPFAGSIIARINKKISFFSQFRFMLVKNYILSLFIFLILISLAWYLPSPYYQSEFTLGQAFTVVPVGFISMAVPITPLGIGVTHTVFDLLYKMYDVNNGASFFNFYLIGITFMNLIGIFFYIFSKKKVDLNIKE